MHKTNIYGGLKVKGKRQTTILEIIREKEIETQEGLLTELHNRGCIVTQATVSRDIKELGLVKLKGSTGRYYYSQVTDQQPGNVTDRLLRLLRSSIISVDYVRNMVVVKTITGTANAPAEALDSLEDNTVLGSLAGDNTVLVILSSDEVAPYYVNRLQQLIK